MSIVGAIAIILERYRARRRRRMTRMIADQLPEEIQKDIGWRGFIPETGADRYPHDKPFTGR
jgi:hypothetical protein